MIFRCFYRGFPMIFVDVLGQFPPEILQEFGETIQIQGTKVREPRGWVDHGITNLVNIEKTMEKWP